MKNIIIAVLFAFFSISFVASAAAVPWDFTGTQLRPLPSTQAFPVVVNGLVASTATTTTLCLAGDGCRTTWPSGGGGGTLWEFVGGVLRPLSTYWTAPVQVPSIVSTSSATSTFRGAVAIGTTTPLSILHLEADNPRIYLLDNAGGARRNYSIRNDVSSFYVRDESAGLERLTIDSSGNVGIGTSTPSTAFVVIGTTTVSRLQATNSGVVSVPSLSVGGNSEGLYLPNSGQLGLAAAGNGLTWNGSAFYPNTTNTRDLGIAGTNIWRNINAGTVSTIGTSTLATTSVTSLSIGTLSGILKATAGAIGTALVNLATDITGILPIGNGGIGTSTPPATDQILVGNASGTYDVDRLVAGANMTISTSTPGQIIFSATNTGSGVVASGTPGQIAIYSATGTTVSATSTIFIAANTTVGVGTSTPLAELHIQPAGGILPFLVSSSTGSALLQMLTNGNVGIGTSSPVTALSVVGTTTTQGLRIYGLPGTRALFVDAAGNATTTAASASLTSALSDETGSGVAVFGTSPTFTTGITVPLVIGGTAVSSALTLRSTSGVGTSDAIIFQVGNNGATEAGRITTLARWGIGSTTPATQFVVGSSTATNRYMSFDPNGTSTLSIMGSSTVGSRIIMRDATGTGCTSITTNAGTLVAAVVACP